MASITVFGHQYDSNISMAESWTIPRIELNQRLVLNGQANNPLDSYQQSIFRDITKDRERLFSFILEHRPDMYRQFINAYMRELKTINNDLFIFEEFKALHDRKTGLIHSLILFTRRLLCI